MPTQGARGPRWCSVHVGDFGVGARVRRVSILHIVLVSVERMLVAHRGPWGRFWDPCAIVASCSEQSLAQRERRGPRVVVTSYSPSLFAMAQDHCRPHHHRHALILIIAKYQSSSNAVKPQRSCHNYSIIANISTYICMYIDHA